jgi:ribonuclease P protein component
MLPKVRRVPIQYFPKNSKVVLRTKNFTAKVAPNNLFYNRVGVIIARAVGSAVQRNKLRRLIMAFFGNQQGFWNSRTNNGKDIVIIAGNKAALLSQIELKRELEKYVRIF